MDLPRELERIDFVDLEDCNNELRDKLECILHEDKFRKRYFLPALPTQTSLNVSAAAVPAPPASSHHLNGHSAAAFSPGLPPAYYPHPATVYIHNVTANLNYGGVATSLPNNSHPRFAPPPHHHGPVTAGAINQEALQQHLQTHVIPVNAAHAAALSGQVPGFPGYPGGAYGMPPTAPFMPLFQNLQPNSMPVAMSQHSNIAYSTAPQPTSIAMAMPPPPVPISTAVTTATSVGSDQIQSEDSNEVNDAVEIVSDPNISVPTAKESRELEKENMIDENESDVTTEKKPEEEEAFSPPVADVASNVENEKGESTSNLIEENEKSTPKVEDEIIPKVELVPESKPAMSWASLFHKTANNSVGGANNLPAEKPVAKVSPYEEPNNDLEQGGNHENNANLNSHNHTNTNLTKFLKEYQLNHRSASLKPRGLSNRSNWCFVNAIMQAIVACPPFFNFMRAFPVGDMDPNAPALPISKAIWGFIQSIEILNNFPKLHRREKSKKADDLPIGKTVEASSIYSMLLDTKSDTFKVIEGRQEDAEEFLTFLLNGINDEIQAVLKPNDGNNNDEDEEEFDADEWKEVGPKNKSCTTRRQNSAETPLADMFQGQIRSCVQHSASEPTATLQPFFTLQLDIQSEKVKNVNDALRNVFDTEALDGYVCSATKKEVEASRSLSLESLPPILILHLKRFIYDENSGGGQKLLKPLDFPVDLEIVRDILSPNNKNKFHNKQRMYKLFAVVYHNGSEATKGHYVTDIYHTGLATWLRCDDSQVKAVSESTVLSHAGNSVPYILFYRRADTMMGVKDRGN